MHLEKIEVIQITLPLIEPYHLAFGDLHSFSMLLVRAVDGAGFSAWGEATANPGYSTLTIDDMWNEVTKVAPSLIGMTICGALKKLQDFAVSAPESACAVVTALESLDDPEKYAPDAPFTVPLLATVNATRRDAVLAEVQKYLQDGYTTLKVKAGWDVDADIAKVRLVQDAAKGRAVIRIDANQGYDAAEASEFVRAIPPEGIELFEQPFAADDWDAMARLKRLSPLPLMLDESIHGEDDLDRVIRERTADFVKFKLTKAGSLARLGRLVDRALAAGLGVVVGNGVAGEIGCFAEAALMRLHPSTAGENNGFAKLRQKMVSPSLSVRQGSLSVPPGFLSGLDSQVLASHTDRSQTFE